MTSRDFCYWLQGYFEISGCEGMNEGQTEMVKRHLALVFKHEIDPSYGGDAAELQTIHDGKKPDKENISTSWDGGPVIRC